jgi:hypothetical protein
LAEERIPLNSLQKAIYARLVGFAAIATATGKTGAESVYDDVPEPTTFPYIVIGETEGSDEGTKDGLSKEIVVSIYAFSSEPGYLQLNNILNAILEALTSSSLTLTDNFGEGISRMESWSSRKEPAPDGNVIHRGLLKHRFVIYDTS